MRRLFPNNTWDIVDNLIVGVANMNYLIEPGTTRILDFGCGAGGLVYALRDRGYDAYGFDLHERVEYRAPEDRKYFGFANPSSEDTSNSTFVDSGYSIPFPEDTFDLVFSTSVLEHIMNLDPTWKEIARVTKPTGIALHVYPLKGVVIEPHIYVPFASRFHSWSYFYFWALLGIRNEFQVTYNARQTADSNALYLRTGLKYYSDRELRRIGQRYYDEVQFVGDKYYKRSVLSRLYGYWKAIRSENKLAAIAQCSKMSAVLLAKKSAQPAQAVTTSPAQ